MRNIGGIEKLLTETAVPNVVEGVHRATLKGDLLQRTREENGIMVRRKRVFVTCCVALALVAAGWAGKTAYNGIKTFIVERQGPTVIERTVHPDGSVTIRTVGRTVVISSDDPYFTQEQAYARWADMNEAIAAGNYKLVETKERDEGVTVYIYRLMLPNGGTQFYCTNEPLP